MSDQGRAVVAVSIPHKMLSAAHDWLKTRGEEYPSLSSLVSRALAEKIGFLKEVDEDVQKEKNRLALGSVEHPEHHDTDRT